MELFIANVPTEANWLIIETDEHGTTDSNLFIKPMASGHHIRIRHKEFVEIYSMPNGSDRLHKITMGKDPFVVAGNALAIAAETFQFNRDQRILNT
jgi:hypothetical protein